MDEVVEARFAFYREESEMLPIAYLDGFIVYAVDTSAFARSPWIEETVFADETLRVDLVRFLEENGFENDMEMVSPFLEVSWAAYTDSLTSVVAVPYGENPEVYGVDTTWMEQEPVHIDWMVEWEQEARRLWLNALNRYSLAEADWDLDGDGIANWEDLDEDGDGVPNDDDKYPRDKNKSCFPPVWYLGTEAMFVTPTDSDMWTLAVQSAYTSTTNWVYWAQP